MENSEAEFTRVTVNGGDALIPTTLTVENIEWMSHVDGAPGLMPSELEKVPEFIRNVSLDPANLTLALCDGGGKHRWPWGLVVLARCSRGWQRVRLETSTCSACSWQGLVGDPTVYELYFGTENEESEYRGAFYLSRIACPSCNGKLARHAIWADPHAL